MKYIVSTFVFLSLITSPAFASDPFLSGSGGGGSYAGEIIRKKEKLDDSQYYSGARAELPNAGVGEAKKTNFRGTISSLLNQTDKNLNRKRKTWTGFERVEGTEAETKFYESSDYKVIKEFSKPIPKRKAFGNKLDSIEGTLRRTRPKNNTVPPPRYNDKHDSFFGTR